MRTGVEWAWAVARPATARGLRGVRPRTPGERGPTSRRARAPRASRLDDPRSPELTGASFLLASPANLADGLYHAARRDSRDRWGGVRGAPARRTPAGEGPRSPPGDPEAPARGLPYHEWPCAPLCSTGPGTFV